MSNEEGASTVDWRKVVILGGGLAGTLVSLESEMGEALVLDSQEPERGSSAPVVLCHPFPGRSFASTAEHARVVALATGFYRAQQRRFPGMIQEVEMIRPLRGPAGERLRRSWSEHTGAIAGVPVSLRSEEWLKEVHPGLAESGEALSYPRSFSIEMESWLEGIASEQEKKGQRLRVRAIGARRHSEGWEVVLDGRPSIWTRT